MSIIDRYIGKQIIIMISVVVLSLLGVDVFFYLVNELQSVGKGDYTLFAALQFVVLTIPRKIYIIFPWGALLGALLALGNLARNSELVAMRAASISVSRIAWAAIKAGIVLSVLMFICGEVVSPTTEAWAQKRKTLALSRGQAIQAHFGTWVRHGNEFIYIGTVKTPQHLENITRYKLNDQLELQSTMHADIAQKHGSQWELENIHTTTFNENKLAISTEDHIQEDDIVDSNILQASAVKHLERMTLKNLHRVIKSRIAQELSAIEYQRAFWAKVVQPFTAIIMIFLTVPFVFGPLRTASYGSKTLVGILVGFSFYTLNSIFAPLTSVAGLSPILAAMIPALTFLSFGLFMIRKVR